jgi:hypothetical protein
VQDIRKIKNFCKADQISIAEAIFFPVLTGFWGVVLESFSASKNSYTG